MKIVKDIIATASSIDELSASELTILIQELIANEVRPGGPYRLSDSVKENVKLNAIIYNLFAKSNKYLENVHLYVNEFKYLLPKEDLDIFEKSHLSKDLDLQSKDLDAFHKKIYLEIDRNLPKEVQGLGLEIFTKIATVDRTGEITQLSKAFLESISSIQINKKLNRKLQILGLANFYTWMAYSLFDKILDEEGFGITLPLANIFHRRAYQYYLEAGVPSNLIQQLFNDVDKANIEELAYCRFKIIKNKIEIEKLPNLNFIKNISAKKSIAHCLGPIELSRLTSPTHLTSRKIATIFEQYCLVRQMNDDIHDWEEDFRNGHITYINAFLLKSIAIKEGSYSIEVLINKMRKAYWDTGLEKIINEVQKSALKAEENLINILNIESGSSFLDITIRPIIKSLSKAYQETINTKEFLKRVSFKS